MKKDHDEATEYFNSTVQQYQKGDLNSMEQF
jgi:hypothetical protein